MQRCLLAIAIVAFPAAVGCDKNNDTPTAPSASAQAAAPPSASTEHRGPEHEREHEWDGGRH